jgi:hypothetical protein
MAATMRVSARIYQLGGLQRKDMHVANSILDDVKSVVAAKAIDKTCLRWPDIPGLPADKGNAKAGVVSITC